MVFKKIDAKLEKGIRAFRASALMAVLAKLYAAGWWSVGLLHKEPEPMVSIVSIYAGAIDEYFAEALGVAGRSTRCLGSWFHCVCGQLGCENSVRRGQSCGVEDTYMGTHGHVVAALLEEMKDVKGCAFFAQCIRQGSVQAPVLWGQEAKYVLWESRKEEDGEGNGRDLVWWRRS